MKPLLAFCLFTGITANAQVSFKTTGFIERFDSAINNILSPGAKAEIIAEGFDWSEGPLWIAKRKMLLFSDVPRNTIYQWTEKKGVQVYLKPSGYTDTIPRGGETGSNGLTLDKKGRLILCQHGDRRIARMDAHVDHPKSKFITMAGSYSGKRFNSPNDATVNSKGEIFFTDPPYGLERGMNDPEKELSHQGVYKVSVSAEVMLVTDSLSRPNGIAFFPGEKTFIVANSDRNKPNWYAYDIDAGGTVVNGRIFYSAAGYDPSWKGGMDGLKIDSNGNVFATGPGGLLIFNSSGKLLGKLRLTEAASNCALSEDEKTVYITNDMYIIRFTMR